MQDLAQEYRESLIEALSDFDDDIANKYLEGEDITDDELKLGVKKRHSLLILSALFLEVHSKTKVCKCLWMLSLIICQTLWITSDER